jgi:hypothetical protein
LRDLLADHFLSTLGVLSNPEKKIVLWFFYVLYSGGALENKSAATKALKKSLGDNGAIRADGIREFRLQLPAVSLLGCALGNRVLPGRIQVGDLRPRCIEWGVGDMPISELLSWEYLTRREDNEAYIDNNSMIVNTEVLKPGVVLDGGIDFDHSITTLEKAALYKGLALLKEKAILGADNRRGFGRIKLLYQPTFSSIEYDDWLNDHKDEILAYMISIGALE